MKIILITRDRPELTRQTIESMRKNAAHYDKHSLLVVVDGDESDFNNMLPYLQNCQTTYTGKQIGVGGAKNFGANRFFNEYDDLLMFSDNDMYYLKNWDRHLEVGLTDQIVQLGGWKHPYHHGITFSTLEPINGIGPSFDLQKVDAVTGNCFVIRWEDWIKYGPFDANAIGPGQSEDFALSQRIISDGGLVATLDPPVAIHCGITNSSGAPAVGWEEMAEMAAKQIKDNNVEDILIEAPEVGLIRLRRSDKPTSEVSFRGLNVGSGQRRFDTKYGWLNVDCVSRPPSQVPDVILDATKLTEQFEENSQDMVVLHHVLEHFGCGEADEVVKQCYKVLKPGGSLLLFVPDMQKLAARWLGGELSTQIYMTNIYGAYMGEDGDRHKWGYTGRSLEDDIFSILSGMVTYFPTIKLFDWRTIPGMDAARDWWVLAMEVVK